MEEKVKIPPNVAIIIVSAMLIVGCAVMIFLDIETGTKVFLGVLLSIAIFLLLSSCRSFEFTKEGICVCDVFFLRRHISLDRISAMRFVAYGGQPGLFLFLDGKCRLNDHILYYLASFFPRKIIFIRIWEDDLDDYMKKLSKLYGNISVGDSYLEWKTARAKNEIMTKRIRK